MTRINCKRLVKRRIPIVRWLASYSGADALGDVIAGLTVGLTLIPQAIAYASLAGLSAQYGLYSSFAGSLVYILFGTCREVNIGPTAVVSLLTYTYARGIAEYATLLCFLSGCVTIALAILRLGFLVEFISRPVVSGFTSAVSIIVASSQIKGLLGIKINADKFIDIWMQLYEHLDESRMPDFILSCSCIIFLLVFKSLKDIKASNTKLRKILWLLAIGRNAIVVLISSGISYYYQVYRKPEGAPFLLTGQVDKGFPNFQLPAFSFVRSASNNETMTVESFTQIISNIGSGVIVVPVISLVANVAIAKAFTRGQRIDATQEMLTLGICNVAGSLFQSMPVSGSFSRSAVSDASGVRTPMSGLYTGLLVILALTFLTPYFYYIPRATLSSVIICAVVFMVEFSIILPLWNTSRRDLLPASVTFFACLFAPLEFGILIGVLLDIAILVYFNARPTIHIEDGYTAAAAAAAAAGRCYVLVRPSAGLQFPAVNYLKTRVTKSLFDNKPRNINDTNFIDRPKIIVLDCKHIDKIDFTALQGLSEVVEHLNKENVSLVLFNPTDRLSRKLQKLVKDPISSAHSDLELLTILGQIETTAAPKTGNEMLERANHPTNIDTTKRSNVSSTDL